MKFTNFEAYFNINGKVKDTPTCETNKYVIPVINKHFMVKRRFFGHFLKSDYKYFHFPIFSKVRKKFIFKDNFILFFAISSEKYSLFREIHQKILKSTIKNAWA